MELEYNRNQIIREFFSRLSIEDQKEWLIHRRACDQSLFFFIKEMGAFMKGGGGDSSLFIHRPICDRWQNPDTYRQAVHMPRAWRKTTCLTIWGNIWEYLQNNEIRILVPSEKQDTAAKWIKQIGTLVLNHRRLRWIYPELLFIDNEYIRTHRWSGYQIDMPRVGFYPDPTIECVGIRGAAQGGHYDLVSADDLVGEKGFESAIVMEDAKRWLDNVEELLDDPSFRPGASRIRILGTHWSPSDIGTYIQDRYPEFAFFIVPCRKDSKLQRDPKKPEQVTYINNPLSEESESNFPEAFPTEHYIKMLANPEKEIQYWSQHMNVPSGGSIFTKFDYAWIRWYHFEDRPALSDPSRTEKWIVCDDGKEFRVNDIPLYGMIDPGGLAEKWTSKGASRNAMLVGGQPSDSYRKFVVATWAKRIKQPSDFKDELWRLDAIWHPRWKVEIFGQQAYIYRDILEEKKKRGSGIRVSSLEADNQKNAKEARIDALKEPMANGEIYLHKSMKDLIGEIQTYPGGLTKDLVDMLGAINKHHWTRQKPGDLLKQNAFRPRVSDDEDAYDERSILTGY